MNPCEQSYRPGTPSLQQLSSRSSLSWPVSQNLIVLSPDQAPFPCVLPPVLDRYSMSRLIPGVPASLACALPSDTQNLGDTALILNSLFTP